MILNKMGPGVNMIIFEASIFLSSFLLFQVQPMIGKFILPWFGGTPTVWSTAMLFFQIFLTGGYAYAAWLMRRARQSSIHITLLNNNCVSCFTQLFLAIPDHAIGEYAARGY